MLLALHLALKFNARRNARRQANDDTPAPPVPPAAVLAVCKVKES